MKQSISSSQIKVTLNSSLAGQSDTNKKTIRSLGLTKFGSSRVLPNINTILGQVNKVIQFVKVEAV
jgi:ribosomal protein L30